MHVTWNSREFHLNVSPNCHRDRHVNMPWICREINVNRTCIFHFFCHVKWNYGEITVTFFTKIVKFSEKTVSFVTYLVTFRWTIHQYVTNTVTSVTIISLYCHFTWQKKWKIHVLFTFISRQIHGTFTWRSRWHIRVTFTSISRQINVTAMVTHYGDIHVHFTAN